MIASILMCLAAVTDTAPPEFFSANEELRGYLVEAGENNPRLHSLYSEWRAALKEVPQAYSLDDPMLTYGYFLASDINTYQATLSQKFPWFGTLRARKGRAASEADAALERFYSARNALFAEVKHAYFEYAFLGSSIDVTQAQLELLVFTEDNVRSKYSLGRATEGDLLRVQIEKSQVQDRLDTFFQLRPARSAILAELLGRTPAADLPWPQAAELPPVPPAPDAIFDRIRERNPELVSLDHVIESHETGVKLARKKGKPDFTLGYGYTRRTFRGGDDFQVATVGVNIPIWRGRIRAGVQEAKFREEAATHRKAGKALSLEREAEVTLAELEDARRRIALYEDSLLPKAEQSYRSLQSAYAAGGAGADFLDLLNSVRLLLEFQLDQLRAVRDLQIAAADLENLAGGPWASDDAPGTARN